MNYSTYRISLEIQSIQSQVSLPVTLGDTARRLYINLTDGGKPYVIAEGCRATLAAHKADGKNILHDCIIEKGTTIRYDFTEQTATAIGLTECHIMLYGDDGELLASPRFSFVVHDDVVEMDVVSEDDLASIGRILAGEQERTEACLAAIEETNAAIAEANAAVALASTAATNANAIASEMEEKLSNGYFNGTTPHIGANGNWWIGKQDTGVRAEGRDGGGFVPYIGENRNWWIAGEDTGVCAEAITPHVGENGNWWIGNQDTGNCVSGVKIAHGEYTGTGTYGSGNSNTLTFDFCPKLIVIVCDSEINGSGSYALWANGRFVHTFSPTSSTYNALYSMSAPITDNGDGTYTVSWRVHTSNGATFQLNVADTIYNYVAIG